MIRRLRARGDRGSVVIEFAFVMPILFLLMLGLCDFALAELSDTAGSNAAREGARVGILYFDGAAGTTGSTNPNFLKIADAVTKKLAGTLKGTPTVTVRCLNPDSTPRPSGGSCSTLSAGADPIVAGKDFIEVTVLWSRRGGFTGFIKSTIRTDKAVMRIVGTPPTAVSPPAACSITAASANPGSVTQTGGALPAVTFNVTVNDRATCGGVDLIFPAESAYPGPQTMSEVSAGSANFQFTMPAGQGSWTAGAKTVTATSNGGSVTQSIGFTVTNPATCTITATSPVNAQQSGGKLTAATTFNASVNSIAACGTPTITFPASTGMGTQSMTLVSGTAYSFTIGTTQGTWSAQTYPVTVNGNAPGTTGISFVVSNAPPPCALSALSISPNTAPTKKTGQQEIQTTVTITVTRSSATICAVPAVTVTPGKSGTVGSANDLTTPKATTCSALTCTYTIANGTNDWYPSTGARTVTVTASGSTVTGTLTIT